VDSTVIDDMELAVRGKATGNAVRVRPPVKKSLQLLRLLSLHPGIIKPDTSGHQQHEGKHRLVCDPKGACFL